jgi:hypothetical protein
MRQPAAGRFAHRGRGRQRFFDTARSHRRGAGASVFFGAHDQNLTAARKNDISKVSKKRFHKPIFTLY